MRCALCDELLQSQNEYLVTFKGTTYHLCKTCCRFKKKEQFELFEVLRIERCYKAFYGGYYEALGKQQARIKEFVDELPSTHYLTLELMEEYHNIASLKDYIKEEKL